MHYYEVAPNQIIRLDSSCFTYSSNQKLEIGQIVSIEVGKKTVLGVVVRATNKPSFKTKAITSIIESNPLPRQLVDLALWMSDYYLTPLATVLQTILPRGLQKKRRESSLAHSSAKRNRTKIVFNKEQALALKSLDENPLGTHILYGVTGSGKTELYIEIAKKASQENKSTIILVPEIALTTQLVAEFSNAFDDPIITHSNMTEAQRHLIWLEALYSQKPRIVIGPRSALFTPLEKVGAVILDEAHETGYKQEQAPKYSALRAASILGKLHGATVIFGSATPTVADRYLAESSNSEILRLTKPARKNSTKPDIELVDMTNRSNFRFHKFLSNQLIEQIEKTLANAKQTLIFHNRRGSASTTLCEQCGWTALCPRCYLPLSLHSDSHRLHCHICGYDTDVPTSCPVCKAADIIHKGIGTKLVESELTKLFPDANIARFDADNGLDKTVNNRYQELYDGKIDIIIGTQVVAKGLDLPNLRTVGVIQADTGLALPDYNANERTFQLLSQVIGRVGRNEHATNVIVQSYQPKHPSITHGINQDYESFYQSALIERKKASFPPFSHLLKLTCTYKTESAAIKNAKNLAELIRQKADKSITVLGPTPAFYERLRGSYRWQLIIKSPKRQYLLDIVKLLPPKSWQFELDPTSLL
jgi:primosomal protein N' (replication factor Y) (superfamily II helicase)